MKSKILGNGQSADKEAKPVGFFHFLFFDPSTWSLVFSNIIAIVWIIIDGWSMFEVMWLYWIQSVIIGMFNFHRILTLKEYSTKSFKINGRRPEPTASTKYFTAFFFLAHYGIFHLAYAGFMLGSITEYGADASLDRLGEILLLSLLFLLNHGFSYFFHKDKRPGIPNIGKIMMFPYARIIPMHLTIVTGVFLVPEAILFFLLLKMFADIIMHVLEHTGLRMSNR